MYKYNKKQHENCVGVVKLNVNGGVAGAEISEINPKEPQQQNLASPLISSSIVYNKNNKKKKNLKTSSHNQNHYYYSCSVVNSTLHPDTNRADFGRFYNRNRKSPTLEFLPLVQEIETQMAGKTKPTKKHSSGNNKNNRNRHNSTGSAGSGSAESMASISPSPPAEQAELIEFKEAGEPLGSAPLGNGFVNGIPGLNYVSGRINNVLHTMEKIPGTILSPVHGLLNNSNAEQQNGEIENDEKASGKVSNGGVIQEVLQIPGNLVNGIVSGNDPESQENEQHQGGGLLGMTLFPFFGILLNVVNISSVQEMFAKEGVHMFVTIAKETGVVMKQQLIVLWQILANLAYNHPILLCLSALIGSTVVCPVLVIMTLILLPFGLAISTILAPIWLSLFAGGLLILISLSPVLIFTAMIVFIFRRYRTAWIKNV